MIRRLPTSILARTGSCGHGLRPSGPGCHDVAVSEQPNEVTRQVPLTWPLEAPAFAMANQFAIQLSAGPDGLPDGVFLSIGQAAPPVLTGTPEEQGQFLMQVSSLPVTLLGRVFLTRLQVDQLSGILAAARQRWDEAIAAEPEGGPHERTS